VEGRLGQAGLEGFRGIRAEQLISGAVRALNFVS
jgi:hypothetical protein